MKTRTSILLATLLAFTTACSEPRASGEPTIGDSADQAEGGASAAYAELFACDEAAFGDVKPLSGPGYDPETGIVGEPQSEYVVHATMLYWRQEETEDFYAMAADVMAQLGSAEGLLAYAIGTDEVCGAARSMGIWRSEEDMYAFVTSGAHAKAMGMTTELASTGKVTHWTMRADELATLDWDLQRAALEDVAISGYSSDP